MQIITEILSIINTKTLIFYGPTEIPVGHHLYGKKLYSHGSYTRYLILSNYQKLTVIIFRFREILPPGSQNKSKTYSLLPFFITPLERYINTVIDDANESFFFQRDSLPGISNRLCIPPSTIRRWIFRFKGKVNDVEKELENLMISTTPGFRPATSFNKSIVDVVKSIYKKVFSLVSNKNILVDYGITSWLNLTFQT